MLGRTLVVVGQPWHECRAPASESLALWQGARVVSSISQCADCHLQDIREHVPQPLLDKSRGVPDDADPIGLGCVLLLLSTASHELSLLAADRSSGQSIGQCGQGGLIFSSGGPALASCCPGFPEHCGRIFLVSLEDCPADGGKAQTRAEVLRADFGTGLITSIVSDVEYSSIYSNM